MPQPAALATAFSSFGTNAVVITPQTTRRCILTVAMVLFASILPVIVSAQTQIQIKLAPKIALAPASASSSATLGQWAAPVNFCTYPCMVGADAAVLHTGKVLFYYYPATGQQNSQAMVLDPVTGIVTNVALSVPQDVFCSGLSILPNGQVLVTGGNVATGLCSHTASGCGTTSAMLFDPGSSTWTAGQDMNDARWYPSSVELGDGTLLEFSGTNSTGAAVQKPIESYNYTTGKWTLRPTTANLPSPVAQVYPRLSLL